MKLKEKGISCQDSPSVIGKASTAGITLVALVVTIVVLLILAGITIVYVFGENGVFKLAQEAKEKTEQAKQNEQEYFNDLDNVVNEYVNKYINGTGGTTNPPEEKETNWAAINEVAKKIAEDSSVTNDSETTPEYTLDDGSKLKISIGETLKVKYDGETRRVRVLGFKHDDLVDTGVYGGNHSKASISFEFLDFITGDTYKQMNTSDTNSGGWANTQMRKDLNGYTTNSAAQSEAIGGLGANLNNKSYIKQVKKKYVGTYDNTSTNTCNDYLWLLADSEIVNSGYQAGAYGYAITSEGSQYKFYQGVTDAWNAASTSRVKYNDSGSAYWWWLRSPHYYNSSTFCTVGSSGDANNNNYASYSGGVAPGFSI